MLEMMSIFRLDRDLQRIGFCRKPPKPRGWSRIFSRPAVAGIRRRVSRADTLSVSSLMDNSGLLESHLSPRPLRTSASGICARHFWSHSGNSLRNSNPCTEVGSGMNTSLFTVLRLTFMELFDKIWLSACKVFSLCSTVNKKEHYPAHFVCAIRPWC